MPERFRTTDGYELAWHELGSGSVEPPIVLQHGFTSSTQSEWVDKGHAARIAALGRRVISVDALGHGLSDKPHDPAAYGEVRMARDISALLDHLGIARFDLVGYSMGAIISLLVATREPRLRRLVIGGVGEAVVLLGGVDTRAVDNWALVEALLTDDPASLPPHTRGFRNHADANGADLEALAAHARVVHATPMPLDRITAPTLLLAGDIDPLAMHPRVLAAAIPECRVVVVAGDHGSAHNAPGFITSIVDFLR